MDSAMPWYESNLFPISALLHKVYEAITKEELVCSNDSLLHDIRNALENYNMVLRKLDENKAL